MSRLATGGQIDRSQPIHFRFNGKSYRGFEGDTLASALLANGVLMVARSFKYHRPRGLVAAGLEEPNALVQLHSDRDQPNMRATAIRLVDGLDASSVNCWPSLNMDVGVINGWFSQLFPAGFYYKTFMWGPWHRYAKTIRRIAGLGTLPASPTATRNEKRHAHTDVLVIGAGPAGISAALSASKSGARVMLLEQDTDLGGCSLNYPGTINGGDASQWLTEQSQALSNSQNITVLKHTMAFGYYDHNMVIATEQSPEQAWVDDRLWHIRARHVVLATGSVERPLVFANNDRPGIMLFTALLTYVHRYAVCPGKGILVFTNNDSVYEFLSYLKGLSLNIVAVVDTRTYADDAAKDVCESLNIPRYAQAGIVNVLGSRRITGAVIHDSKGHDHAINCDMMAMSGGFNPLVHLHSQSGAKPVYDDTLATFVPGGTVQNELSAGAANGIYAVEDCILSGVQAGARAAIESGHGHDDTSDTKPTPSHNIEAQWHVRDSKAKHTKAFVYYQNDVTVDDVKLALSENFTSVEHVKRYTTAGMAVDQGKISNANVIGVIAQLQQQPISEIGTTTYRPPYHPVNFASLTGLDREHLIIPARTTPITAWHKAQGAVMNEAGANFRRPFYYPHPGETMSDAITRAALAVRENVGVYDGTPLGKFELVGKDVGELLDRVYTNRWQDLQPGHGRYGLMLREDGRLLDDGVTFRLNDNRYLMTTSTGAASDIYRHLLRLLKCEWTDLDVQVVNVTSAWTNICVCGPKAREVLLNLGADSSLVAGLPFMQLADTLIGDWPVRLARVSYTGELSFEINIRTSLGLDLWVAVMQAGADFNISPVGSETSAVLRIEKGFISPGAEGDNITNPFDAGLGWVVAMDKPDFIGKRTLQRDLEQSFVRQHVVGLLPQNEHFVPVEGSALLPASTDTALLMNGHPDFQGHVTAACFSPTLNRSLCLALLKDGHSRVGETITISGLDNTTLATVTLPVFYDPKGHRMRS